MSDDPVTAREMIAAYRATVRPPPAATDRMAQALAAAALAPVIPLRPAPPRRSSAVWLALAAALALVAASTYWLASARHGQQDESPGLLMAPHDDPPTSAQIDEPAAPLTPPHDSPHRANPPTEPAADDSPLPADEPAATTTTITPTTTPAAPRRVRPPRPADEPAAKDPVLAELELVQQIKDALDAGRPADALRLIDRHVRTFARGSLVEERDALRVTALCAAGKRAHGLREQQAFLSAHPRSAYGDRVRAACAD